MSETTKPSNPKDLIGSNKLPLHLFPLTAVAVGCLALLEGALKYGRSNFREVGIRSSIYYDAARRHLDDWFEGTDIDPDSDIDHLGKALACIAIIIDAQAAGKLQDDRMVRGGYKKLVTRLTPMVAALKERHADKSPKHYTIADNAACDCAQHEHQVCDVCQGVDGTEKDEAPTRGFKLVGPPEGGWYCKCGSMTPGKENTLAEINDPNDKTVVCDRPGCAERMLWIKR